MSRADEALALGDGRREPWRSRWHGAGRALQRMVAFGLVPALSMLTLLVVIPAVAREHGEPGVVAVSVGQSVGALLSILTSLGWPLTGPAAVARASPAERAALYRASISTRLPIFLACAPIGALVTAALLHAEVAAGVLCAVAFTTMGFANLWYYSGTGRPRPLLLFEAIPRLVATAVAGTALYAGAPLLIYPLALLAATIVGLLLMNRDATGYLFWLPRRSELALLRDQLRTTVSRVADSAYVCGTTPLVAFLAPQLVFVFASYDRVLQSAINAASFTIPSTFVHTVASQYPPDRRVQSRVIALDATIVLACGSVFYLVLPFVLRFLYGPVAVVDERYRALLAIAFALLLMVRCLFAHGLLPLKDDRRTADILGVAAPLGLLVVGVLTATLGVLGAFVGLVVTNAAVVVIVGLRFVAVRRRVSPS